MEPPNINGAEVTSRALEGAYINSDARANLLALADSVSGRTSKIKRGLEIQGNPLKDPDYRPDLRTGDAENVNVRSMLGKPSAEPSRIDPEMAKGEMDVNADVEGRLRQWDEYLSRQTEKERERQSLEKKLQDFEDRRDVISRAMAGFIDKEPSGNAVTAEAERKALEARREVEEFERRNIPSELRRFGKVPPEVSTEFPSGETYAETAVKLVDQSRAIANKIRDESTHEEVPDYVPEKIKKENASLRETNRKLQQELAAKTKDVGLAEQWASQLEQAKSDRNPNELPDSAKKELKDFMDSADQMKKAEGEATEQDQKLIDQIAATAQSDTTDAEAMRLVDLFRRWAGREELDAKDLSDLLDSKRIAPEALTPEQRAKVFNADPEKYAYLIRNARPADNVGPQKLNAPTPDEIAENPSLAEPPERLKERARDRFRGWLRNFFLDPYRNVGRLAGTVVVQGSEIATRKIYPTYGVEAPYLVAYLTGLTGGLVGTIASEAFYRGVNENARKFCFGMAEGALGSAAFDALYSGLLSAGIPPQAICPPGSNASTTEKIAQYVEPNGIDYVVKEGDTLSQVTQNQLHLGRDATYEHQILEIKTNAGVLKDYALAHGHPEIYQAIQAVEKMTNQSVLKSKETWNTVMTAGKLIGKGMHLVLKP